MSYRTVMAADLQGYGSAPQNVQELLQRNLVESLREAAAQSGLDAAHWTSRGAVGGLLTILPFEVSAEVLVGRFVRELNGELRGRNRLAADRARTRLRLAIHHGPPPRPPRLQRVRAGGGGAAVRRRPLREALDRAGTDLGVIVSEFVWGRSRRA